MKERRFDHKKIEEKWRAKWRESGIYDVGARDPKKEKEYILVEWPYPSGNLHTGHWYAFAVPDIYVRKRRMEGKQVLFPMGFDAFGLPAENAAIKRKLDPKHWTDENMAYMRGQLESMGAAFSWDKTTSSTDPAYYKWTQWMFAKFFDNDIAYRGVGTVNWCPGCNTVIANEQVLADGTCERSGDVIEKREMPQWLLRIIKYADRLIDDLDTLDWPEAIKDSQRNWIGRSEGAEIDFVLSSGDSVTVFTTRPDTLFGATYMVLAPEHRLVEKLKGDIKNWDEVDVYRKEAAKKDDIERTTADKEKTGVKLEGVFATNPANGEEIPVFVADYVLAGYGTGAIMAVPAHDERDLAFAKKFELPIKVVVKARKDYENIDSEKLKEFTKEIFEIAGENNFTLVLVGGAARRLVKEGSFGTHSDVDIFADKRGYAFLEQYLKEKGYQSSNRNRHTEHHEWNNHWSFFSDGVYMDLFLLEEENGGYFDAVGKERNVWGEKDVLKQIDFEGVQITIPDINVLEKVDFNLSHNWNACYTDRGILTHSGEFDGMDSEEAKKKIVEKVGGRMTNTYRLRDWSIGRQRYWGVPIPIVYDPDGKAHAIPEEHLPWTLPTDVDFTPTGEPPLAKSQELKERTERIFGAGWTPDVETMDTFVDSSWYYLRYLDAQNDTELASKQAQKDWMQVDLYFGGAEHTTMHLLYSRFWQKALYDLGLVTDSEPYKKRINRGLVLGPDGNKMSKSKGNVIDPDEYVAKLGADTVKMYLAFMGPYGTTANYPWDMGGIAGIRRFLERVAILSEKVGEESSKEVTRLLHQTIKKVGADIESHKFNTAISALMVFVNLVEKAGMNKGDYALFLRIFAPFAPFLTEELWEEVGETGSVHEQSWPAHDESLIVSESATVAVQVDGKTRATMEVANDTAEDAVVEEAKALADIVRRLEGLEVIRTVYVPNRIVNFITRPRA